LLIESIRTGAPLFYASHSPALVNQQVITGESIAQRSILVGKVLPVDGHMTK
jgi:hypothetical protein